MRSRIRRPQTVLAAFCLTLFGICCFPTSSASQEHAPPESGHNDRFLDPDLDVEGIASHFESESREVFAAREQVTEALNVHPGMVVADIGAGTGAYLDPIVVGIGESGHYYGVEISPRFAEHIRDRAMRQGYRNVSSVLSAFESATLPAASIDLAFVCDTYHHFDDHEAMLASIRYAMKPGAELVIVDFDKIPGQSRTWILEHIRATKDAFRSEIEAAGFVFVEEIEVEGLEENFFLRFRRP